MLTPLTTDKTERERIVTRLIQSSLTDEHKIAAMLDLIDAAENLGAAKYKHRLMTEAWGFPKDAVLPPVSTLLDPV